MCESTTSWIQQRTEHFTLMKCGVLCFTLRKCGVLCFTPKPDLFSWEAKIRLFLFYSHFENTYDHQFIQKEGRSRSINLV